MSDEYLPTVNDRIQSLEGSVWSQGPKIGHRAFLDMGSKEWGETPDNLKSAAYQAAMLTGWGESALKDIMVEKYAHLSENTMDFTLKQLKDLVEKYPLEIEEIDPKN